MIPLISPKINFNKVKKGLKKILESGILTKGPKVKQFEEMVARYVGSKYAFSTTSCTTALHLSLAASGIKRGDEVLVSDFTFPATANVVVQQGARPVLVDIDLDTYNMDLKDLEKKITKKTRAIIPVDAFGCPVDMISIMEIAKKYKLFVIEDAACALGAEYKNKKSGSLGDVGCFSFHPRKSITTGEGGMITTNNDKLAKKISILRDHGGVFLKEKGFYSFEVAGFNYRMTEIQALIGICQMKNIDRIISQKRKLAKIYSRKLANIEGIRIPKDIPEGKHTFQSYVVLLGEGINRNKVIQKMKKRGIETTLGTYALHAQPFFMRNYGYKDGELKNSFEAFKRTLTLPLYSGLTIKQIDYIVDNLKNIIKKKIYG
jgi:dTDP-4-amino-4,6-dideoxygalactose transaminase